MNESHPMFAMLREFAERNRELADTCDAGPDCPSCLLRRSVVLLIDGAHYAQAVMCMYAYTFAFSESERVLQHGVESIMRAFSEAYNLKPPTVTAPTPESAVLSVGPGDTASLPPMVEQFYRAGGGAPGNKVAASLIDATGDLARSAMGTELWRDSILDLLDVAEDVNDAGCDDVALLVAMTAQVLAHGSIEQVVQGMGALAETVPAAKEALVAAIRATLPRPEDN